MSVCERERCGSCPPPLFLVGSRSLSGPGNSARPNPSRSRSLSRGWRTCPPQSLMRPTGRPVPANPPCPHIPAFRSPPPPLPSSTPAFHPRRYPLSIELEHCALCHTQYSEALPRSESTSPQAFASAGRRSDDRRRRDWSESSPDVKQGRLGSFLF